MFCSHLEPQNAVINNYSPHFGVLDESAKTLLPAAAYTCTHPMNRLSTRHVCSTVRADRQPIERQCS